MKDFVIVTALVSALMAFLAAVTTVLAGWFGGEVAGNILAAFMFLGLAALWLLNPVLDWRDRRRKDQNDGAVL